MISSIISYDYKKDVNSKEQVPITMFGEEVGTVDLGLIVRWDNYVISNGGRTCPLGSFINGKMPQLRGASYKTKDEFLSEYPKFEEKYGVTLSDFATSIIKKEIHEND